jgi:protocatechuate 3,4-dioxygenase beta subunit
MEPEMNERHAITRREIVRLAGAAGVAYVALPEWLGGLAAHASAGAERSVRAAAVLTPELTEGPYWVNTMLRRSDVRANTRTAKAAPGVAQAGVPLSLTINVLDATDGRRPLNGVAVDIWHANAHGLYSDEGSQQSAGGTTGGDTSGQNFLRGYQITGEDAGLRSAPVAGQVSFTTIWPGWYTGRAIHIHVRVRRLATSGATIAGYTTQIFFSDADNDRVLTGAAPYNTRAPQNDPTTDENDTVLQAADRATNVVPVTGSLAAGFAATFTIVLDAAETTLTGSLARPSAGGPGAAPPGGNGTPP